MKGVWVQSLVGELRFHVPCGQKIKRLKKKKETVIHGFVSPNSAVMGQTPTRRPVPRTPGGRDQGVAMLLKVQCDRCVELPSCWGEDEWCQRTSFLSPSR